MLCNTTLILPGIAVIFQVTSVLPFSLSSAKNTSMTVYLLESSLAWFKKCCVLFSNYCVFAKVKRVETNSSPWRLVYDLKAFVQKGHI